MEERVYDKDPYCRSCEGTVLWCRPAQKQGKTVYEAAFDRVLFYPEGGGQPSDTGTAGESRVLEAHQREGQVVCTLDRPLEPGSQAVQVLDWDRRFSHMQHHTGEHLFSGLVHRRFGYDNVGFHMGREEVTVDFNGLLTLEEAEQLEREANQKIWENVPVRVWYPSPEELETLEYRSKKELDQLEGPVRMTEVPGADCCACCGTHVGRTGEIGMIKVTGLMHYKGGVRLSLLCGGRALQDYSCGQRQLSRISVLLSAKPEEAAEAVERLKQSQGEGEGRFQQLFLKYLQLKADTLPESGADLLVLEEGLTPVQLRRYCTMLTEQHKGGLVLVCSGDGTNWKYALGSLQEDVRPANQALCKALQGRGGGSSQMTQGSFEADAQEIRRHFQDGMWRG
mgnify:CR=1 FL=1